MEFDRMRRRLLPALAAAMLLAGCQTTVFGSDQDTPSAAPPPCPRIAVVPEAGRLTRFEGGGRDVTNVLFEAEIQTPRSSCVYRDNGEIVVSMAVPIVVGQGPANRDGMARLDYFVAIARGEQRLVKQVFDVTVEFEDNATRVGYLDELQQTIPLR